MSKRIIITSECIACGLCTASRYVEELPDGKVKPRGTGIVEDKDMASINALQLSCPQKAIILEKVKGKSKAEIEKLIEQNLMGFSVKMPPKEQIKFDEKYIQISIPSWVSGEGRYEYSSSSKAKRVAQDAVDSMMYSQRKGILKSITTNYRAEKLRPYTVYEESKENFYYLANTHAQELLNSIIAEIQNNNPGVHISDSLKTIQTRPNLKKDDHYMLMITDDLLARSEVILHEISGSYYTLEWYVEQNIDIDDSEEWAGTGAFGRDKYVTKYCFRDTRKAFEDIAKDLKDACKSYFPEYVVDWAYSGVESIVKNYETQLKAELKSKAMELKKML